MCGTYLDVEFATIDRIIVSVESLHTLAGTNIPHCNSFVSRTRSKDLGVRLELNGIDRVDVAPECESAF